MIRAEASNGVILLTSDYDLRDRDRIKQVDGARFKAGQWSVPLTWASCMRLRGVFKDQLILGPGLIKWATSYKASKVDPAMQLRQSLGPSVDPVVTSWHGSTKNDLYGFQEAGVEFLSTAETAYLCDDMGVGKGQGLDYPILTPYGWEKMGSLKTDDLVIGSDGQPTHVTGIFPRGVLPTAKVTFNDGATVVCDLDHIWTVRMYGQKGRWRNVTTQQLLNGEKMRFGRYGFDASVKTDKGFRRLQIPILSAPVEYRPTGVPLPLDPYLFGTWLGDGSSVGTNISTGDSEIFEEWERNGFTLGATDRVTRNVLGLMKVLRPLGVLNNKHVPENYMLASPTDRLSLLQGLMDTDGHIEIRRGSASFNNTNEKIIDAVVELVQSLGGIARKGNSRITWYPYKGQQLPGKPSWAVEIKLPPEMAPVRLPRRLKNYVPCSKYTPARYIESVELTGESEEIRCISVEAEDQLYVTNDYVVTHNTAQTISTLRYLEESGRNPYPAIIVAPTSLTTVWKNEFEKWYPAGVRISMIKGNITQRRAAIEAEADVYIINYESVRSHSRLAPYGSIKLQTCVECDNTVTDENRTRNKCERCPKELNAIEWRTIIADEAHRLKDPKAKQTRAVWALNKPAAQYVYCLTGTAMTDAPHDLWGALHLMKPESFPSRGKFLDRYCDLAYNPFGGMTVKGLQDRHSEEFFSIIDPMLRRMPKDVVLPFLPQKTYVVRESPMVPAQKRQYDQLKKGMLAELKNGFMMVENMLTQATRLAQLACASMEETEDGEYRMVKPSGKINGLMDLLNDMGDKSLVVFSASRQLLELAKTALDEVKISWSDVVGGQTVDQRDKAVKDFQDGRVQVILAMTGAGGEGLTMTRADTVCFLQRPWKMGQSKQAEDRVHRIGSEVHEKILVVDLITPDTVEAKIHRVLAEKGDRLEEVMRDQSFIESLLKDD